MEDYPEAAIILVENGQISQQAEATEIVPSRILKIVLYDLQQAEGYIFALAEEICNDRLLAAPSPVVEAPRLESSVAVGRNEKLPP
ncbi:hypothetical protein [Rhizobium sp. BK251]|uniref:hypothetical protein n=1 Tax=Rhizobium sp. BK251 TaxID=2512125 RepID=UPI0010EF9C32|nr:hypothetical protein [Rhizobium sp. BK251]TCL67312.1 hypothetical protein EV286_110217 [Rhizobium sp. BK251]